MCRIRVDGDFGLSFFEETLSYIRETVWYCYTSMVILQQLCSKHLGLQYFCRGVSPEIVAEHRLTHCWTLISRMYTLPYYVAAGLIIIVVFVFTLGILVFIFALGVLVFVFTLGVYNLDFRLSSTVDRNAFCS